tara:strand:- start:422 stop:679 length:258 start_codon:yes stop_codon:yes gene_type:complete
MIPDDYDLVWALKDYYYQGYYLTVVVESDYVIEAQLTKFYKNVNANYMDDYIRRFTKDLSENLREYVGKNVFYDIINGKLILWKP